MGEEWSSLLPDPGAIPQVKRSKYHSHARRHRGTKAGGMTDKSNTVNSVSTDNNKNDGNNADVTENT